MRHSRAGQWTAATFAVCGIVLNRIDVGGVAHPRPDGAFYLPSWTEIAISVGVVSAAVLVFLFVIEHFKVWEERPADPNADPLKLPELDPVGATWLGVPGIAARTTYSLAFILAAALGFGFLKVQPAESRGIDRNPGSTRTGRRSSVDRRQPRRFRRYIQARGAREARRRQRVVREVPSHEPAQRRRFSVRPLPPGHVFAGGRIPA